MVFGLIPQNLSLTRRLILGASAWSFVVIAGAVFALSAVYRAQTLAGLDNELDATLLELVGALDVSEVGDVGLNERGLPSRRDYVRPLGGWYYAVLGPVDEASGIPDPFIKSPSHVDENPLLPDGIVDRARAAQGTAQFGSARTPGGAEMLRVAVKAISIPERPTPLMIVASADRAIVDRDANRFRLFLTAALGVLAAGLLAAMWGSLRLALRPLSAIEADVADVREGRKTRLADDYPVEVRPLSEELNKLLEHNRAVVERARTHVGNLAHALKTPLAVMMNEASGDTALDDVVRRQAHSMNSNVQHYLKRAQAAARAETIGARTPVRPVMDDLTRLLNKLFAEKMIEVKARGPESATFRGERQDLEEILGNLMENACKYATEKVEVSVLETPAGLVVHVDDDGPGLTPEQRSEALKRGVRLDEQAPGTGLGLSIVAELAEMHSGSFELTESPFGGLRATVRLARA
ncbi:MAG: ATP-binding protein [Pseudomonadota bacterium]